MGVRFLGSIFGFDFGVRFLQKAPNRRIAHFLKIKPKIQTQNSYTFPNPRVRFWKGVGRWWGRRAVYGWLLVGSRQGKQGYRPQLLISSLSLPPLHRLFGVLRVPSLKHPKLKKTKKNCPSRTKILPGRLQAKKMHLLKRSLFRNTRCPIKMDRFFVLL